ncbi:MAG: pantoate--beta-alanine ligase [Opitutales bacterium]|nr:pantoate--beta-alanine ligase [Opitutales bacterium]
MQVIHSIGEMQYLSEKLRQGGGKIGFVPTMGYLHDGHLSLVDLLKEQTDTVILSIFVNPIQFGKGEDLEKYPRDLDGDMKLCQERGVDVVFIPAGEEIYRDGHSTLIREEKVSQGLCGKTRPSHFQGVTTICAKLFNICQPHCVALGQKDAQQVVVLKRMIMDLNFPIEVVVGDIFREKDGLAMSSRNSYLTSEQRCDALFVNRSLRAGEELVGQGTVNAESITQAVISTLRQAQSIRLDYVEVVDRNTMEPEQEIIPNQSMIVLAVWIGKIRLIDNLIL